MLQSALLFVVDLTKGEQATAFSVSLMILPQMVGMCARGELGVPLVCALCTALAARKCVHMVAHGEAHSA